MIYDKTDKGRQEISTRKHRLDPKLRVFLVMVDGKHSGHALLREFSPFGFSEQRLLELVDGGFIQGTAPAVSATSTAGGMNSDATTENQNTAEEILDPKEAQYQ